LNRIAARPPSLALWRDKWPEAPGFGERKSPRTTRKPEPNQKSPYFRLFTAVSGYLRLITMGGGAPAQFQISNSKFKIEEKGADYGMQT
jgi:hypothetical protein